MRNYIHQQYLAKLIEKGKGCYSLSMDMPKLHPDQVGELESLITEGEIRRAISLVNGSMVQWFMVNRQIMMDCRLNIIKSF